MKDNYKRLVGYARNFLVENHYCETVVQQNEICFEMLGAYLEHENADYTPQRADEWFAIYSDQLSASVRDYCRLALSRLRDFYECGEIRPEHSKKMSLAYTVLKDGLKKAWMIISTDSAIHWYRLLWLITSFPAHIF